MPKNVKVLKKALRYYALEQYRHALLELNAAIAEDSHHWLAYCIRGRVHAVLKQYPATISDYSRVLAESNCLNQRNRRRLLHGIMIYTNALSTEQKSEIAFAYYKNSAGQYLQHHLDMDWQEWCAVAQAAEPEPLTSVIKSETGRISNIGKFLLDANDRAKIIELVSHDQRHKTTTRILRTYKMPG